MKYQKYLVLAFVAALFLPMLSAKSAEVTTAELNLNTLRFIEMEDVELGFDTDEYLPESFDPYANDFNVESLNFIEDDSIELDFDTADYLPENFDPHRK